MLEGVTVDPDYRVIYGKPDTPRGVSPVWEAAPGNLLAKASKALGAYLIPSPVPQLICRDRS